MIEELKTIIKKKNEFRGISTSVINCVIHMGQPITERPDNCRNCFVDMQNWMEKAQRANTFLNELFEEIEGLVEP